MAHLSIAVLVGWLRRVREWLFEPLAERGAAEPQEGESGALGPLDDDLLGFDDIGGYRDGGEDFE